MNTLKSLRLTSNETPANNGALGVIDLAVLAGLRELQQPGESDFVSDLIVLFLDESRSQLKVLRRAIADNNVSEVRRIAHLLKGSSAGIGATRMATLYQELETKEPGFQVGGSYDQTIMVSLENEFQQLSVVLRIQQREFEEVTE